MECLCELLRQARSRGQLVGCHNSIQEAPRFGGKILEEVFLGLGRDLSVELRRLLDKARSFDDTELAGFEMELPTGDRHLAPSVAWAHQCCRNGIMTGCLTPPSSARLALLRLTASDVPDRPTANVYFAATPSHQSQFFRTIISSENVNEGTFADLVPAAFPNLSFAENALRGCRDLSRPFVDRKHDLVKHFSVLSDHGQAIFGKREHRLIQVGFREHGIDISPETSETMRDGRCKRARERTFNGETLTFEWHSKIEPNRDRIHVHPGNVRSGGQVIVGILSEHLPLPGD